MNKFTVKKNKEFWDSYAKKLKENPRGAHSDSHIVDLENNFIENKLNKIKPLKLLDIGCGNGTRTIKFSKYVKKKTLGVDYSEIMIKNAKKISDKKKMKNIFFEIQDANFLNEKEKFDVITSCRCFVNQNSTKKQIELFRLLYSKLKKNGSLIIAEQSQEGVERLNKIRKKFGLENILVPWHNLPLRENKIMPKIDSLFRISEIQRLGAFYYLSRVIHPALVFPSKPNPNSKINDISEKAELFFQVDKKNHNMLENFGSHLLIHFIKK